MVPGNAVVPGVKYSMKVFKIKLGKNITEKIF
jgi:hypothetical protein